MLLSETDQLPSWTKSGLIKPIIIKPEDLTFYKLSNLEIFFLEIIKS